MNKLRLVLILQLAFFAAWAGWLFFSSSRTTAEFCLNTVPVDPRDMLSGTYLALAYDISRPKGTDCETVLREDLYSSVYVQLAPGGASVKTGGKELPLYTAVACSSARPAPDGKIWVTGRSRSRWVQQIDYGIEKFYISEDNPLKSSKSGEFAARVKMDGLGNLRLVDLIKK